VDSNHQELINSQSCCRYITGDRHGEHSARLGSRRTAGAGSPSEKP
jgi:hypothetical protein